MNQSIRRMLAILAVFGIFLMGAVPASASSVSWTTVYGTTYHLTLNVDRIYDSNDDVVNQIYRDVILETATPVYHVEGAFPQTHVVFPFPFTASVNADHKVVAYNDRLAEAISREGLYSSFSVSHDAYCGMEIPSSYPTGYYMPAVRFMGHDGSWTLTTDVGQAYALTPVLPGVEDSGILNYAPDGEIAYTFVMTG